MKIGPRFIYPSAQLHIFFLVTGLLRKFETKHGILNGAGTKQAAVRQGLK
jgi:hypothetical protein